MASEYTSYYNLDKYVSSDKPNLRDQYNAAMDKIDAQMYANHGLSSTALNAANDAVKKTNEEIDRAKEAEKAISDSVTTLEVGLEKQISDTADSITSGYQAAVNAEAERAKAAESAEATRAKDAEEELTHIVADQETLLSNEVSARKSGDVALSKRVDTVESKIETTLKTAHKTQIITVGDSYSQASSAENTWPYWLGQLDKSIEVHNYGVSGAGFNVSNNLFHSQIESAHNNSKGDITDPNAIEYIVIAGGRNDIMDADTTYTRVKAICDDARTWFPNAQIIIVPMLWDYTIVTDVELNKASNIADASKVNGANAIIGAWIWNKGINNYYQSDKIHPNAAGAKSIAGFILSALKGSYSPRFEHKVYSWNGLQFSCTLSDNMVSIRVAGNMNSYSDSNFPTEFAPILDTSVLGYTNSGSGTGIFFFNPGSDRASAKASIYGKSAGENLGGCACNITFPA